MGCSHQKGKMDRYDDMINSVKLCSEHFILGSYFLIFVWSSKMNILKHLQRPSSG